MIKQRMKFLNSKFKILNSKEDGAALLVVLFIIMAITILSLGFISRSDVELACGENMILRTQMDYLAESGLEHAKGLILNPQDVASEYWSGATAQQLAAGSADYYDLTVVRDDSDPADHCNYTIDCNSYRMKDGQEIGRSSLSAQLRLDPCVALWIGGAAIIWPGVRINGDVYCSGTLENKGVIKGDVFASALSGSIAGRHKATTDLSLAWPRVTVADFTSRYSRVTITSGSLSGVTLGPYSNPVQVCYRSSDLLLAGDVRIESMLVVVGDLTIQGDRNIIVAPKNLPALLVTGDLIVRSAGSLQIEGLAVVNGRIFVSGGSGGVNVIGGLFTQQVLAETAADSSGNNAFAILRNGPVRQPSAGKIGGSLKFDGLDDYAEVENEPIFDITSRITVSAWIKVNAFNRSFQTIATKGDSAWRIQRWSNTNGIEFACTGLPHNQYGNITGNISVNDGQWHHVAGVYDGTQIYLYIDGVLDVSLPTSGSINTNNYKVMIGENAQTRPSQNRCWNGWIDDVRVYNRGLSAVEINTVKAGGAVSGLVAHWRLDEAGSNVAITAAPTKTAIICWSQDGTQQRWGQAAGAFFRSIRRN